MIRILASLSLVLCCGLHLLHAYAAPTSSLEVHSTSGIFLGSTSSSGLDSWLGIPFAQPPVGSLRFKAPVPIVNHSNEVFNASTFGDACPQVPSDSLGASMSEDCLYLNVSTIHIEFCSHVQH